jgi:DNA-binding response OmpR family regulator
METILLIDDNEQLILLLKGYLEKSGYKVFTAENGKEGIEILKQNIDIISIVTIDFSMPVMTGPEACEIIRKEMNLTSLPIIMLTSMSSIEDKKSGYNSGADDYLLKPFEPEELILRIESLFKRRDIYKGEVRVQKQTKPSIEIDKGSYRVIVKGKEVKLSPVEFDLFYYLYQNANNYVSSEKLLENVFQYPPGTGSPENVRSHIRNLRIKLEEDPGNPKIITSLLKRGYMLNTTF